MSKNEKITSAHKSYDVVTTKNLEQSQVEISGSIPTEVWEKYRPTALKNINEAVSIDGFRKGMIPENILISKVGEMAVLEEAAELAVSKAYIDIITDKNIDAIGRPEIRITKLAIGNTLDFTAITAIVPTVTLPDYTKIAAVEMKKSGTDEEKVTEKEIEEAILRIRKSRISHDDHDHDKMTPEEHDKVIMDNLPPLTDEFVKTLGAFENITEFKTKVSELVLEEKKNSTNEKRRIRIADAIVAETTIDLPNLMLESELKRTEAQFKDDIERMGVTLEDYLKHAKKTLEDLRTEWKPYAEKKAKLQLILNEISKKEKIAPSTEEIETEINHIVEHYKDSDRERAGIYAETVLTNEKVFQFLEGKTK